LYLLLGWFLALAYLRFGAWLVSSRFVLVPASWHETARNEPSAKVQAGKRQEPATKQVQAPSGMKRADPPTTDTQAPTQPRSRYNHKAAGNQPNRKAQAGKRQKGTHQADTTTKRHETSETAQGMDRQAAKQSHQQMRAGSRHEMSEPRRTDRQAAKNRATEQVEARSGTKRANHNFQNGRVQADTRQKCRR
jgi:hypothetical protein